MGKSETEAMQVHIEGALPCPFCGSTRIVKGERYFAMCVDCGATGPERSGVATKKFTADWNTRVKQCDPLTTSTPKS